ncbi:hypothetical protein [Acinetobacter sp.]|uniref:hypothetical protein n=1 Tax=Acinetobacter sp. TaxID=472 RepID=UPI0031D3B460
MFSDLLSMLALIVAGITALYTYQQSDILKEQHFKQEQLEKELNSYAVVIGSDTDKNLEKNIKNGEVINFSFYNGSNRPVPYKVEIRTDGLGVYLSSGTPDKIYNNYPYNHKRSTLIHPNGQPFQGTFSLWFYKKPMPKAKVSIWVNGKESVAYSYEYNKKTGTYDYIYE